MSKKIGILYIAFYNQLVKRYGFNRVVTKKQLCCDLGKHFLVPKPMKLKAINEFIKMEILAIEDKYSYLIKRNECLLNLI